VRIAVLTRDLKERRRRFLFAFCFIRFSAVEHFFVLEALFPLSFAIKFPFRFIEMKENTFNILANNSSISKRESIFKKVFSNIKYFTRMRFKSLN